MAGAYCFKRAAPALLAALISLAAAGCGTLGLYPADPLAPRREALRAEAAAGVEGPATAEYRAMLDALFRGYEFPGTLRFELAAWERGRIGLIALEPPPGAPRRGTIVAYHGFMSYSGYNVPGLARLAERGWLVLAADLPGHGFSTGLSGAIGDFKDYALLSAALIAWARERGAGGPWVALGHSAGGAAALASMEREPTLFDAGVLLAPLVRPAGYGRYRAAAAFLGPFVAAVPPYGYEEGFLGAPFIPLSYLRRLGAWQRRLAKADPAPTPLLCLWGEDEDAIDVAYSRRAIARAFPAAQELTLPGVGHIVFDLGAGQEAAVAAIGLFLDRVRPLTAAP